MRKIDKKLAAQAKVKKKVGRPTLYNEFVAEEICRQIATSSKGLQAVCSGNDLLPAYDTVVMWLVRNTHPEFSRAYARAKECQAEHMEQEIITLADAATPDNFGRIEKAKLQVDARKWTASKLKPKRYGDRPELFLNPQGDDPLISTDKATLADKIGGIVTLLSKSANK